MKNSFVSGMRFRVRDQSIKKRFLVSTAASDFDRGAKLCSALAFAPRNETVWMRESKLGVAWNRREVTFSNTLAPSHLVRRRQQVLSDGQSTQSWSKPNEQ